MIQMLQFDPTEYVSPTSGRGHQAAPHTINSAKYDLAVFVDFRHHVYRLI